jgi:hypothetical protein
MSYEAFCKIFDEWIRNNDLFVEDGKIPSCPTWILDTSCIIIWNSLSSVGHFGFAHSDFRGYLWRWIEEGEYKKLLKSKEVDKT